MSMYEVVTIFLGIFSFLLTALLTVLWFNFRKLLDDFERHREKFYEFQNHVITHYPNNDEFKGALVSVSQKLDQVIADLSRMAESFRDRLDRKVDKT